MQERGLAENGAAQRATNSDVSKFGVPHILRLKPWAPSMGNGDPYMPIYPICTLEVPTQSWDSIIHEPRLKK